MVDQFQKLLELQADSIADIPLKIPFEIQDSTMLPDEFPTTKENEKLMTEIVIEPQKVGTVFRFLPLVSKIKKEDLAKITVSLERDFDESAPEVMARYGDTILEVICLGIHNRKTPYPDYLPVFLKENCTWKDMHFLLNAILFRMGTMAFINSTIRLTEMGPGAEELIALQTNLESWKRN